MNSAMCYRRGKTLASAVAVAILSFAVVLLSGADAEAGSAKIAGVRMNCHAANVVVSNEVPGPGFALAGTILLGPKYLKKYPPIVQRLIFLHECAHQYVGPDEVEADCWAVKVAKRQGWLTPAGVKSTCKAIWHTNGGYTHPNGPERCAKLIACYGAAKGRKQSARKKKS